MPVLIHLNTECFSSKAILKPWRTTRPASCQPCQSGIMLYYAHAVDWPEARKKRAEDLKQGSRAAVIGAVRAGVQIALGTDAGGGAARHGRIAREAELMVECGLEPRDALIAATLSASKW